MGIVMFNMLQSTCICSILEVILFSLSLGCIPSSFSSISFGSLCFSFCYSPLSLISFLSLCLSSLSLMTMSFPLSQSLGSLSVLSLSAASISLLFHSTILSSIGTCIFVINSDVRMISDFKFPERTNSTEAFFKEVAQVPQV